MIVIRSGINRASRSLLSLLSQLVNDQVDIVHLAGIQNLVWYVFFGQFLQQSIQAWRIVASLGRQRKDGLLPRGEVVVMQCYSNEFGHRTNDETLH